MLSMTFKLGKTYQFAGGPRQMTIVGSAHTRTWGWCLIGEDNEGNLLPVGMEETNAQYWHVVELSAHEQTAD